MKRHLSILVFSLFLLIPLLGDAQGNGGNGNGYGNGGFGGYGNGNGNGYGQANSPWASWHQWLISWLENGGQVPPLLAADVIWEARAWGQQNFGLNYGQMLAKYAQGSLSLTYISTAPPTLTFRIGYGGLNVIVVTDL